MLNFKEVISILDQPDENLVSNIPPLKPKAGEIYVTNNVKDVTCNQYYWVHKGSHKIPQKKPLLDRRDYNLYKTKLCSGDRVGNDNFKRIIYYSLTGDLALVHYTGDESRAVEFPHGNAVHKIQKQTKTLKSTLACLEDKCTSNEPGSVYKKSINETGLTAQQQGVLNAKNKKQLENLRYKQNCRKKLTHDSAYNTLQLAYNLDNFVVEFALYPELRLVLASKQLADELNRLLSVKGSDPVLLSYDTTFDLGDFYVSPLIVKHPFFKGNTCFPIAFLIHGRKNQKSHDTFWRELVNVVPNLLKHQSFIVTDRETAFGNSIQKYLPNAKVFLCWNHVKSDVKFWIKKHGGKSDDLVVYLCDIDEISRSDSEAHFEEIVESLS